MPKVSRETASEHVELEGVDVRLEHLDGGYSVCFESHTADAELGDLFRGLPDDRCQLPRWGYVLEGRVTFRFADREETYAAGDAYFVPPGPTSRCTTRGRRSSSSAPPMHWARRSPWSWGTSSGRGSGHDHRDRSQRACKSGRPAHPTGRGCAGGVARKVRAQDAGSTRDLVAG